MLSINFNTEINTPSGPGRMIGIAGSSTKKTQIIIRLNNGKIKYYDENKLSEMNLIEHTYRIERKDRTCIRINAYTELEAKQKFERERIDRHIPNREILKVWNMN